jgi:hypothetical protein
LRIDDFCVFGDTVIVRRERGGRYLCMVRSRSLGKWSGTTICGLALCPDIFHNNCFPSEQILDSGVLEGRRIWFLERGRKPSEWSRIYYVWWPVEVRGGTTALQWNSDHSDWWTISRCQLCFSDPFRTKRDFSFLSRVQTCLWGAWGWRMKM